ncbi:MAG: hypothetical protein KJ566_03205 [Nanoarchaeota archaeon]|nr:hypothetical protein [Nanoarchaeota archaeon]
MGNRRRVKKNKKQGMYRQMRNGKKPMSPEQKAERKAAREAQKQAVNLAKEKAKVEVKVKTE